MPKKIKDIIRNNFISSTLILILTMEIVVVSSFVFLVEYIELNASDILKTRIEENISLNATANAAYVSEKLLDISNLTRLLQNQSEELFSIIDEIPVEKSNAIYEVHQNGALYDANPNSISALYYADPAYLKPGAIEKVVKTERLNDLFVMAYNHYNTMNQIYFNSYDGMTRIYPFIDDLPSLLGTNFKIKDYNFYYLADEEHNPSRDVVWTDVYLDPAGMGWMLSCIAPVYRGDFLEGVFGVDITIDKLITDLLDIHSNLESPVLLINNDGLIIAMNEASESMFNLRELRTHIYDEVVSETVSKSETFNIKKQGDAEFQSSIDDFLNDDEAWKDITFEDKHYYLTRNYISDANWQLIVFAEEEKVLEPVQKIKALTRNFFGLIVILLVLVNIILYRFIANRSDKLGILVSIPLNDLKIRIQNLGKNQYIPSDFVNTNIEEIDVLNFEFYLMSQTLNERTNKLIQAEIEKNEQSKMMISYMKEAMTDKLTGLTNRRGIEDYLDVIFDENQTPPSTISVIIFDIDHFKYVNDNYGHLIGDEVLKKFAKLLLEIKENNQWVARWGGEEFMIAITNKNIDEVMTIAEQLRLKIQDYDFDLDHKITASFGVAFTEDIKVGKRTIIQRADQALYDAKSKGRNIVILHQP